MSSRNIFSLLSILIFIVLTGCSGGGGGGSSSTSGTTSASTTSGVNSAIIKSVASGVDSRADLLIDAKCSTAGGVAIYSGIDTNQNAVLDTDERVGEPQVVCNGTDGTDGSDGSNGTDGSDGSNGTSANFSVEELPSGDLNCPLGGIKLITASSTQYLCNELQSSTTDTDFTKTGTIKGSVNLATVFKSLSRSLIDTRKVTSMQGGLWLTPASVQAAIDMDKKAKKANSIKPIPEPIIEPLKVEIQTDNSYEIPDVPSGEYSLVYIDENT
ncbi:MAG: hypothetical protein U9O83_06665, partial [Campylobacterota bacterium]|nr:hypothetical protein [Campylobacterota bacterium]